MTGAAGYDAIGVAYAGVRRADPRLAAHIRAALGDARTVLNVGAGTGSYEPTDREVIAVEPSAVMIAQRPADAAPAVQASAESLPFAESSVDATMAIFTLQHWDDVEQGLREAMRVTRERIVLATVDVDVMAQMWLARDYLPEMVDHDRAAFPTIEQLAGLLPQLSVEQVPIPADWVDGFCIALWSRPEAHLDPRVRQASSNWHRVGPHATARAVAQLERDLATGAWDRRHGRLRGLASLDVGVRLLVSQLGRADTLLQVVSRWAPLRRRALPSGSCRLAMCRTSTSRCSRRASARRAFGAGGPGSATSSARS
jgi:SAM-dependent methyltransferase